ncbi:hypothetical protein F2Q68_00043594 [Brassica cretica]|uniref:Uncharacterized protein n=1 Tax=Brassica cretica TaxID=69181 RepID=A0A8S9LK03_BRACR|nr:hypothetical protein F2Q68_00043594 [Brassica cretica]
MARAGPRTRKGEPSARPLAKVDKTTLNGEMTRRKPRRITVRETPQPTKSTQLIADASRLYSLSNLCRPTTITTMRLYSEI